MNLSYLVVFRACGLGLFVCGICLSNSASKTLLGTGTLISDVRGGESQLSASCGAVVAMQTVGIKYISAYFMVFSF